MSAHLESWGLRQHAGAEGELDNRDQGSKLGGTGRGISVRRGPGIRRDEELARRFLFDFLTLV